MRKISFILIFVLALVLGGCNKSPSLQFDEVDTEITLTIGEKRWVYSLVDDGIELDWISSNTDVATVDDGLIKAISTGKATITVTIVGTEISETIEVFVTEPDPTSIEIQGKNEIVIGETEKLNAVLYPKGAKGTIMWSSSDESIATIDHNGNVTALKEGTVTITATLGNISNTFSITITLPKPNKITIEGKERLIVGETFKYKALVSPEVANQDVIWSVDGEFAEIDDEGNLTALKEGTIVITCISTSDNNISDTFTITIESNIPQNITINGPNSLKVGEKRTFSVTASPTGTCRDVIWSIEGDSAEISKNGVLTALKEGTCKVLAQSKLDLSICCEKEITIFKDPTHLSCDIPYYLVPGSFAKLEANLYQNEEIIYPFIIYSSSDNDVITIDEKGKMIAKSVGQAVITIKSIFNENIKLSKEIRVLDYVETSEILVIDKYEQNEAFLYDNKTYIMGINAFSKINEAIEKAQNNSVIVLSEGTYNEEINIDIDNLSLTGINATITNKINVNANNVTLSNLNFRENASINGNPSGSITNFTFTNNKVYNLNEGLSFLTFAVVGDNQNENFIISNNTFEEINELTNIIRLSNIKNLNIENNKFSGTLSDAILISGSGFPGQENNITGTGASGKLIIYGNEFSQATRSINIKLLSAEKIEINNNIFNSCGGIQFQRILNDLDVNICFNTFTKIEGSVGIRIFNNNVLANIKVNYNIFEDFASETYKYIDNRINTCNANYNYFDNLTDENIFGAIVTETFASIKELEKAIKSLS
ncbi:MAG TPA: hypothetical protein GXZ48_02300 [Acholeplasmataceae bacterium]|nr:hypothetical protein [Acholeplasmataceae bacterium]